ncbi:response regulator transcription factor [Chloroflexota bacterium]
MKALIIEDSADVVEAMSLCFQIRWPEIEMSSSTLGAHGIEKVKSLSFDIIILDLNLPDIDGLDVLRQIRSFSEVPIIIVTVRGSEDDQAIGLEMGADDYIVKPFRPRDFVARVSSVLRRSQVYEVNPNSQSITRGKLTLRLVDNVVYIGDEIVKLTPNESKLLYLLMKNSEQTLDSKKIMLEVWEQDRTTTDVLRTYIRRLRDKLQDHPPQVILSQRGGGYRFATPE